MDNFLTFLYDKFFIAVKQEKKHMEIHDFDSDNSAIRNDEKISQARETVKLMTQIIEKYSEAK